MSDRVAADYLERHGQASWHAIENDLQRGPSCPKLRSYWHFHGCQYSKQQFHLRGPQATFLCAEARAPRQGFPRAGAGIRRNWSPETRSPKT